MDLQELRDLIIIIFGITGIVMLFVALVVTLVVGLATRSLIGTVQTLLRGEVTPILDSARQTLDNARGTTTFVANTTVSPIIRAYGVVAGVRRVVGVLTGLTGRRRRS
jgi:hypothetical protein